MWRQIAVMPLEKGLMNVETAHSAMDQFHGARVALERAGVEHRIRLTDKIDLDKEPAYVTLEANVE